MFVSRKRFEKMVHEFSAAIDAQEKEVEEVEGLLVDTLELLQEALDKGRFSKGIKEKLTREMKLISRVVEDDFDA